jgi:Tol biopolymer transport system component
MEFVGSGPKRLARSPWKDRDSARSRDGARIVFASVRDGEEDIYCYHLSLNVLRSVFGERESWLLLAWRGRCFRRAPVDSDA